MAAITFIIGLLLLVFGGGCTLWFLTVLRDSARFSGDWGFVVIVWGFLGLLPLVAGILILRAASRPQVAAVAAALLAAVALVLIPGTY